MYRLIMPKVLSFIISALTLKSQLLINEAIQCYNSSIKICQAFYPTLLQLSEVYLELKKFESAHACLNNCIIQNLPEMHLQQAKIFIGEKNYQKANESLLVVFQMQPRSCDGYFLKAEMLKRQHKYEESINSLEEALKINSRHSNSLQLLADIYLMQGNSTQAMIILKGGKRTCSTNIFFGIVYASQYNFEIALQYFEQAHGQDKDNLQCLFCRVQILLIISKAVGIAKLKELNSLLQYQQSKGFVTAQNQMLSKLCKQLQNLQQLILKMQNVLKEVYEYRHQNQKIYDIQERLNQNNIETNSISLKMMKLDIDEESNYLNDVNKQIIRAKQIRKEFCSISLEYQKFLRDSSQISEKLENSLKNSQILEYLTTFYSLIILQFNTKQRMNIDQLIAPSLFRFTVIDKEKITTILRQCFRTQDDQYIADYSLAQIDIVLSLIIISLADRTLSENKDLKVLAKKVNLIKSIQEFDPETKNHFQRQEGYEDAFGLLYYLTTQKIEEFYNLPNVLTPYLLEKIYLASLRTVQVEGIYKINFIDQKCCSIM